LQDDTWGRVQRFDFERFLDFLEAHHLNCIRLWVFEHTRTDGSDPAAPAGSGARGRHS